MFDKLIYQGSSFYFLIAHYLPRLLIDLKLLSYSDRRDLAPVIKRASLGKGLKFKLTLKTVSYNFLKKFKMPNGVMNMQLLPELFCESNNYLLNILSCF